MTTQILEILRKRRSIRRFQAKPVEAEKVAALVEAAVRAPTSRGLNPWEFIVVDDPELLEKLGRAKQHGSELIAGAPLAIVVTADPSRSDVWIEDCAIAAALLHLAAEDLGLGSCWVQIRLRQYSAYLSSEEYVRSLLNLPVNRAVVCVLAVGYRAEEKPGHPQESLPYDRVFYGRHVQ